MVNLSEMYIAISIVALLVIAVLVFFVKKDKKHSKLSPLAGLAFVFVIAGIVFGDDQFVGYGLIGIGVIIAVADIVVKSKKR